jgi:hypothetical protein
VADNASEAGNGAAPSMDNVSLTLDATLSVGRSLAVIGFKANLAQPSSFSPEKTPRSGLGAESVT